MAWQHHATDGRTDSRPPSVLLLGPPSLTHSFARSLAFYRVREHNNFLRLSEKTKVDIYDDGMSDWPLRKGGNFALGSGSSGSVAPRQTRAICYAEDFGYLVHL